MIQNEQLPPASIDMLAQIYNDAPVVIPHYADSFEVNFSLCNLVARERRSTSSTQC